MDSKAARKAAPTLHGGTRRLTPDVEQQKYSEIAALVSVTVGREQFRNAELRFYTAWVKRRNTRWERMFSASPPEADIVRWTAHARLHFMMRPTGSETVLTTLKRYFRDSPASRHSQDQSVCLKSASFGLARRYSMNLSARAINRAGSSRPSSFAALRLMIKVQRIS